MSHPKCLIESVTLPCPLKGIMPIHYALTNEEALPPWYGYSNVTASGLLELKDHKYTLKTIKQGLVFVEWDAVKDDPVVYECTNGKYKELTQHGYPSGKYLITIPDDPSITDIRMLYIRTFVSCEEYIDGKKIEPAWQEIKAHLKGRAELYQTIILWEKPYSGALSEVAPLVEEFREGQGELHYLSSWEECAKILHADQRRSEVRVPSGPHGSSMAALPASYPPYAPWEASIDPGREEQESPPSRKNSVAVLLHDSLGQVLDCQKIYSLSLKGIENFCRMHAPLHASAFLAESILAGYKKQAEEENAKKAEELAKRHGLGKLKPEGSPVAPPKKVTPNTREESYARESEWKIQEKEWRESYGAKCWAWAEKEKYLSDPTYNNEDYQEVLRETQNFSSDISAFRKEFFREHCVLVENAMNLVHSWHALLTTTKPFSFRQICTDCLNVEGTYNGENPPPPPSGLLLLRDALLCLANTNIVRFPALPDDPPEEYSSEYSKLKDEFYNTLKTQLFSEGEGSYSAFLCGILSTGKVPTDEATALFNELWPYCLRPQGECYSTSILKAVHTRLGIELKFYDEKPVSEVLTLSSLLNTAGDFVEPNLMTVVKTSGIDFIRSGLFALLDDKLQVIVNEIEILSKQLEALAANEKRYLEVMAKMRQAMAEAHAILARIFQFLGINISDTAALYMLKLKSGVWGLNFSEQTWIDAYLNRQRDVVKRGTVGFELTQSESNKTELAIEQKPIRRLATAGLVAACGYNILMALKSLQNAPQGLQEQILAGNILNITSSVCSLVDAVWNVQRTALSKAVLSKMCLVLDMLCSYYDTITLLLARNPGAAAGTAIMGIASAAFWVLTLKGVALFSLPFLGVAALLVIGFYGYYTFLDPKSLSFLKNCLWNRAYRVQRTMLQGAFVPCLTGIVHPEWDKWNKQVAEALRDRFLPSVTCEIANGLLSVHVSAYGVNPKVGLVVHFDCLDFTNYSRLDGKWNKNAEINEEYLETEPRDRFIGNVYTFNAKYNIGKFIANISKNTRMDVPPYAVIVTVKYSYATDVEAVTVGLRVLVPPEKA